MLEEEWVELRPKICLLRQSWSKSIWNKIEKSSKITQDKKSLTSTFAFSLTATAKVELVQGRLGTGLCLHPDLTFS